MFYLGAVLLAIADISVSRVHGPFTYFKAGNRKVLVLRKLDGNIFIFLRKNVCTCSYSRKIQPSYSLPSEDL